MTAPWAAAILAALLAQTLWLRKQSRENQVQTNRKLDHLMALVQVEQDDLDALDTSLDEATAAIAQKIQDLVDAASEPLPAAQLDALNADVAALRQLGAPAAVEPPVA